MARGGKKTHQLEDQYGGFEASEDASSRGKNASGFGGGGGFKGGGEGGGGVKGANLKYERVVPKFLEKHADLLVGNAIVRPREEELRGIGDEEEDLLGERRRGFGTTPMTSKEENNTKESIEEQCLTLKGSGNRCFRVVFFFARH